MERVALKGAVPGVNDPGNRHPNMITRIGGVLTDYDGTRNGAGRDEVWEPYLTTSTPLKVQIWPSAFGVRWRGMRCTVVEEVQQTPCNDP